MTTVVVLAEPPVAGETLPELHDALSAAGANSLYAAMLADVCETLQHGEAEVVVNYPPVDEVPDGVDPEEALRDVLDPAVPSPEDLRYEVQVGTGTAARVGNAVTHLLETEGSETAGVVAPTAPFLRREHVGSAAMKLRSSDVVVGPATDGRITFAAVREPIDFTDVFAPPAVETVTDRAVDAGHDVDFLALLPRVERPSDLATALPLLGARQSAGRLVPARTAGVLADLDVPTELHSETGPA
ncbi:hypothetical protein BRD19_03720 [Halobacteriales archaeon SW_7_65_23]|jgi:glycosyltransferase A (GT-A) superfamily protein (DUF2064 family)|nr:MAG: hypothetical protein BRD19_03720 [Halobacteriales archaeon SW_7_65_23]